MRWLPLLLLCPSLLWAAFPQVVDEGTSEETGNVTTHDVAIGSPSSGELVLVYFFCDGIPTITVPDGWSTLENETGTAIATAAFWKVATGSEGATVTVTTSAGESSAHKYYRISGFSAVESEYSSNLGGNPPSLTPSGGAKDYLWLAFDGRDGNPAKEYTGFPANYVETGSLVQENATAGVAIAWGRRELNAASEDPGAFTVDSDSGSSITVAIHPVAATGRKLNPFCGLLCR